MTPVSHGKPCAGNPHARFEEGASAPETPRRNALLHKIDDVLEGTAYKDIGDYIFVLTVVRDEEGSEIMRWLHSDKGISVSRRLRAHLISKKNGRVSSAEPVETEYIGICKKGSKWGEDAFSFHDGKVTINSRRLARQVVFYFKLRE